MQKFIIIVICILLLFSLSCALKGSDYSNKNYRKKLRKLRRMEIKNLKKEIIAPKGVRKSIYIRYLAYYGPEWADYKVSNNKVLKEFGKYFKNTNYRVIWHWDIDGDRFNDYLAVEVYPKIRRGIKKGILVDENGMIKLYIDTIKGVYTPDYMVVDLKRLGHKKNEVECFSIGYISNYGIKKKIPGSIGATKELINECKKDGPMVRNEIGGFNLQRIDKDLKVIGTIYDNINASYISTDGLVLWYDGEQDKIIFQIFTPFSLKEEYRHKRKILKKSRRFKKAGKVFSPPEKLDPEHVKKALRIKMLQ